MTNDVERLVSRLRQHALPDPYDERPVMYADLFTESADKIEQLHAGVTESVEHLHTVERVFWQFIEMCEDVVSNPSAPNLAALEDAARMFKECFETGTKQ